MNTIKTKISIAIPVYNGAEKIKVLLKSIYANNISEDLFDVVVSDNASLDNLNAVLEPYKDKKNFLYFRNCTNIGPDKNFLKCVELSKTKYVWIIGDDDYLYPNAIAEVLKFINENHEAIVVNYSLIRDDVKVDRVIREKNNLKLNSVEEVIQKIGLPMNFLSCTIHNRRTFLSVDSSHLMKSFWLQLGIFLEESKKGTIKYIADPLIVNAGSSIDTEVNKKDNAIFVVKSFFKVSSQYLLDNKTKKAFLKYSFIHVLRKVYIAKRTGYSFRTEDLNFFLEWYKGMPLHYFLIFILFSINNSFLRFFYEFSKKIRINRLLFKLIK